MDSLASYAVFYEKFTTKRDIRDSFRKETASWLACGLIIVSVCGTPTFTQHCLGMNFPLE